MSAYDRRELCRPPMHTIHASQFTDLEQGWFFAYLKAGMEDGFEMALRRISDGRARSAQLAAEREAGS